MQQLVQNWLERSILLRAIPGGIWKVSGVKLSKAFNLLVSDGRSLVSEVIYWEWNWRRFNPGIHGYQQWFGWNDPWPKTELAKATTLQHSWRTEPNENKAVCISLKSTENPMIGRDFQALGALFPIDMEIALSWPVWSEIGESIRNCFSPSGSFKKLHGLSRMKGTTSPIKYGDYLRCSWFPFTYSFKSHLVMQIFCTLLIIGSRPTYGLSLRCGSK